MLMLDVVYSVVLKNKEYLCLCQLDSLSNKKVWSVSEWIEEEEESVEITNKNIKNNILKKLRRIER